MSDSVMAALVGVGGSVIVAIVSVITQLYSTKYVIKSNYNSLLDQIDYNELSRTREKRLDKISETISELLTFSDAELISKVDYDKSVNLILRTQLFLFVGNNLEYSLNTALSSLGHRLRAFITVKDMPIEKRLTETKELMIAQSDVIEKTREVLSQYSKEIH